MECDWAKRPSKVTQPATQEWPGLYFRFGNTPQNGFPPHAGALLTASLVSDWEPTRHLLTLSAGRAAGHPPRGTGRGAGDPTGGTPAPRPRPAHRQGCQTGGSG